MNVTQQDVKFSSQCHVAWLALSNNKNNSNVLIVIIVIRIGNQEKIAFVNEQFVNNNNGSDYDNVCLKELLHQRAKILYIKTQTSKIQNKQSTNNNNKIRALKSMVNNTTQRLSWNNWLEYNNYYKI